MTRITSSPDQPDKPRIARSDVVAFFDERSRKIEAIGPLRAVIYQDKHPDLAERRNDAEKRRLLPLLDPDRTSRVLDVGCGTGRWAEALQDRCAHYHGLDISEGLINYAKDLFRSRPEFHFSTGSIDSFSLETLGENSAFDRILCAGVLIYLNDEELASALDCMSAVASEQGRILLREPMALQQRLTILQHFSEELDQSYNAIYRTQAEIEAVVRDVAARRGFRVSDSGDVYEDAALNNRAETRQRWMTLERDA